MLFENAFELRAIASELRASESLESASQREGDVTEFEIDWHAVEKASAPPTTRVIRSRSRIGILLVCDGPGARARHVGASPQPMHPSRRRGSSLEIRGVLYGCVLPVISAAGPAQ
jgi:hypothetical protein